MATPLVVFGEDWDSHPSSTQHLIRRLRTDRPVIWVNSIGLRRPRLNSHDLRRCGAKLRAVLSNAIGLSKAVELQPNVHVFETIDPLAIPAPSSWAAREVNRRLLGALVRKAIRRHRLQSPILWLSLPSAVDILGNLGERAVVYYCGDDWSALPGVDHDAVNGLEAELVARADLVLAASATIAAKFPPHKTALLPHGVDVALFSTGTVPRAPDLPSGAPVAGFYGTLSEWMDSELLAHAAMSLPEWRFLLIGPVRTEIRALADLSNVILAGQRRHEELAGYVQHWDVSLLPFRSMPMTQAFNPLKLREYLAAGTPIAATPFPALDGYRDLIEIGRTPEEFVAAIRRAGAEGRRRAEERMRRVAGETWEARARQVAELLATL
jgi:glycosyltransferase involved in cell wall biosynthesis